MKSFEVLTEFGDRFRFDDTDSFWQYAVKFGTKDEPDRSVVEIMEEVDDELKCALTITRVICVGNVDDATMKIMPRERRETQCPRCGFCELKQ